MTHSLTLKGVFFSGKKTALEDCLWVKRFTVLIGSILQYYPEQG